ncbi:hypothetical protein H311_03935 [Anncaliia algerae PRA109]|nr:hypothetical protein H311_03935 [Anncaliia algerae PRA109]
MRTQHITCVTSRAGKRVYSSLFKEMTPRKNNRVKSNGYYFRCNVWGCRKEISIRKGTFFEGSYLSFL